MPIYEYECGKGHAFELMVSISGPDPKSCIVDGCRSKPKRMVSASGFILKGSGWYANDYPSESRKQGWDSESKASNPDSAGHTCGSTCSHGVKGDGGPTDESAPPPKALTEPIQKPKKEKNPYSGGSKKKKKAAKA